MASSRHDGISTDAHDHRPYSIACRRGMVLGLVLQPRVGLALGLAAWWALEVYRLPSAPLAPWFPRLRRHLTAAAVLCLSLGAAAPFAAS